MITPIDTQLINDITERSRCQLIKSTIIMDNSKRDRIITAIMNASNNLTQRVHATMINNIQLEFTPTKLYEKPPHLFTFSLIYV